MTNNKILSTRQFVESDADYIWKIYEDAARTLMSRHLPSAWDPDKERASFEASLDSREVHVVELDGTQIGWIGGVINADSVTLEHLYLDTPFRSQGYGTILFEQLVSSWKGEGKSVEVVVHKDARANNFLANKGSTQTPRDTVTSVYKLA